MLKPKPSRESGLPIAITQTKSGDGAINGKKARNIAPRVGVATETPEVDYVPPIEGCTGLVLDNLEENMTNEDIKTILEKACSNETLQSFTIHPTGSLRSKILKDIDPNIIPSIAKKLDKKSFKGRMVFCKPFVPKCLLRPPQ